VAQHVLARQHSRNTCAMSQIASSTPNTKFWLIPPLCMLQDFALVCPHPPRKHILAQLIMHHLPPTLSFRVPSSAAQGHLAHPPHARTRLGHCPNGNRVAVPVRFPVHHTSHDHLNEQRPMLLSDTVAAHCQAEIAASREGLRSRLVCTLFGGS
jgi:hypothetical protein